MSLQLADRIDEQIRRFLSGHVDLDELEDWTLLHAWNVHKSGDLRAERLTNIVQELAMAVNEGTLSEGDARPPLSEALKGV
jgi:hypothetical protein